MYGKDWDQVKISTAMWS